MKSDKKELQLPLLEKHETIVQVHNAEQKPHSNPPSSKSHFSDCLTSFLSPDKYTLKIPIFKKITFLDMLPFVKKINNISRDFELSDTPLSEKGFSIEPKLITLDQHWTSELKTSSPSFASALYRTFMPEIINCLLLLFGDCTSKLCYALLIGKIITMITANDLNEEDFDTDSLFNCAIILSGLVLFSFLLRNWTYYVSYTQGARARLVISGLLFKKLNSVSITSLNEIKVSKVINLIANDLNDIEANTPFLPNMLLGPYMLTFGTFVMWQYFGPACLIGIVSMVVFLIGQIFLSKFTEIPRKENKANTDNRVKFTQEIIECIRLVKMYTWEKPFKHIIENLRNKEYTTFMKIAYVDSLGRNLSILSTYFSILAICIVYIQFGGILSPDKIYASMVVLIFLGNYCLMFSHVGRMFMINFRIILNRVQEILTIKDVLALEETSQTRKTKMSKQKDSFVTFESFTAYWSQNAQKPCLSNINLQMKPKTLTTIIGKIGSGKTSFLLSLLKEIPYTSGKLDYSGRIAYVEQEPIIFSGSLRENILFGRPYREDFYLKVIKAANLESDLVLFAHGDLTLIGERGVNLSGGQKARVSLARALYSESDIYLLDDPLAAVDSRVARSIFDDALKGDILREKLVVLVTHHLNFARESDYVVLMDDGKIKAQGTFEDIERQETDIVYLFNTQYKKSSAASEEEVQLEENEKDVDKIISKKEEKAVKETITVVSWETYKSYLKIIGTSRRFLIYLVLLVSVESIIVYYNRLIGYWALQHSQFYAANPEADENDFNHGSYISTCLMLLVLLPVLHYIKQIQLSSFLLSTNTELHKKMIEALIRAKVTFFDLNPVGRILNRFSNDIGILDKTNVLCAMDILNGATEILSLVLTVCAINPFIIFPLTLIILALYQVRRFFSKSLILAKNLELNTRSPLISNVSSTLNGLIIIRAYHQGARVIREFMDLIYNSSRAFLFMSKTNRLLAVMLDFGINSLTVTSIMIFAFTLLYYPLESALLGLSLLSLLRFGDKTNYVIRQTMLIDINMQSAQRVLDYCALPAEPPYHIEKQDNIVEYQGEKSWPARGEIIFNNVYLKYRKELSCVLNGLSFTVQGGTKVACVGRTGAGKSSIIQALFRMADIEEGSDYENSYIKIDGVDTKTIGLNLLRRKISIIPQTPVVFSGTIKRNLDPFGTLQESQLWGVLGEVGLADYISKLDNKLDTDMTISASVFSAGQKQLMCLARAILMNNNIIVLDEATANVDIETDNIIQKKVMEKFADCTIITIAHRLITIAHYDKVLVMDQGKLVEYDSPYSLLVENHGDSRITRRDGIFADMVKGTGRSMSKRIFDIAKESYYAKRKSEEF